MHCLLERLPSTHPGRPPSTRTSYQPRSSPAISTRAPWRTVATISDCILGRLRTVASVTVTRRWAVSGATARLRSALPLDPSNLAARRHQQRTSRHGHWHQHRHADQAAHAVQEHRTTQHHGFATVRSPGASERTPVSSASSARCLNADRYRGCPTTADTRSRRCNNTNAAMHASQDATCAAHSGALGALRPPVA